MCGLFAFIARGSKIDRGRLERIADLAGRRGPHSSGWVWGGRDGLSRHRAFKSLSHHISEIPSFEIVIGHSRLSTMGGESFRDLEDTQPIRYRDAYLAHNGVAAGIECEGELATGCDSERLLRRAVDDGLDNALASLPDREPYSVIAFIDGRVHVARRRLPIFWKHDEVGDYFCSRSFDDATPLPENEIFSF